MGTIEANSRPPRPKRMKIPNADEITLLRTADVVKLTKLSKTTVYRLVAGGVIPSVRQGRTVRIPLLALRRWIADNTSQTSHASHLS